MRFTATLSVGDNKYTRPRPRKVEKKVHLLDPGSSPRRRGNCEGQVGCPGDISSTRQMADGECGNSSGIEEPQCFFIDVTGAGTWEPFGIYERGSECVLGEEQDSDTPAPDLGTSRCFNCGSSDHVINTCPSPLDRALVSLSRQFYYFFQSLRGVVEFQRIHIVQDWRRQRLEWLDTFQPGQIRDLTLLDALGGQDGDWLANMALWGYPRGWVNVEDPREQIKRLIQDEDSHFEEDETETFFIFGDDDNTEIVYPTQKIDLDEEGSDTESDLVSSSSTESIISAPAIPTRWAQYPPSHFASHLLPIYTGYSLPPISHQGSSTYTSDRQKLWQRIISGRKPPATSGFSTDLTPPPPITGPPPLPPPPPPPPTEPPPLPPPLPSTTPPPLPPLFFDPPIPLPPLMDANVHIYDLDDELDMDLSD